MDLSFVTHHIFVLHNALSIRQVITEDDETPQCHIQKKSMNVFFVINKGRGYLPGPLQLLITYFPGPLRFLRTYLLGPLRFLRIYLVGPLRFLRTYLPGPLWFLRTYLPGPLCFLRACLPDPSGK